MHIPILTKSIDATKAAVLAGPKAFCVGTLYPCNAAKSCRHFGIHNCSTFKKHSHKPCPHYPGYGFICTRIDDKENKDESQKVPEQDTTT